MNKSLLDNIERTGCIRITVILAALLTVISSIFAFFQGHPMIGIGSVICSGVVMVFVVGFTSVYLLRSLMQKAESTIEQMVGEKAAFQQEVEHDAQVKRGQPRSELTATRIGFAAGFIYGVILSFVILVLFSGLGDIVGGLFFGGFVACFCGVAGIIPAKIGWYWPSADQAKWVGATIAAMFGMITLAFLTGEIGFAILIGTFMAPAGWFSAILANSYRKQSID